MKNKFLWKIAFIFTIAIVVAIKFDKFGFAISDGKTKLEVTGIQHNDQEGNNHISTPQAIAPSSRVIEFNKTQGAQSPIVNNSNGTSTITYVSK